MLRALGVIKKANSAFLCFYVAVLCQQFPEFLLSLRLLSLWQHECTHLLLHQTPPIHYDSLGDSSDLHLHKVLQILIRDVGTGEHTATRPWMDNDERDIGGRSWNL